MKKMIDATMKRPYTVTEGLLCVTTGMMLLLAFGLPQITALNMVICFTVFVILLIVNRVVQCYAESSDRIEMDVPFLAFGVLASAAICLFFALKNNPVNTIAGVVCGVLFSRGAFDIVCAFTSEPPDNMYRMKRGGIQILISIFALILLQIFHII